MNLWKSVQQKLHHTSASASDWPTVPANIDVLTVIRQEEQKGHQEIVSYLATLTYFYRNPDLQTGQYRRVFEEWEESAAQQ